MAQPGTRAIAIHTALHLHYPSPVTIQPWPGLTDAALHYRVGSAARGALTGGPGWSEARRFAGRKSTTLFLPALLS